MTAARESPDGRPARSRRSARTTDLGTPDNVVPLVGGQQPMPGDFPVPGSAGYRYTPGAGVWKEQRRVLPWCPVVTRHLAAFSPRGEVTRRTVTASVGEATATVPIREIADGTAWERFPLAAGVAAREVRDALANLIGDQAARLPIVPLHPRWEGGRLALPPLDVMPRGYGELAGTAAEFRAVLREVARSPRMALVVGLAVGGLYVAPLGRQSYMPHLPGGSSEGKTTALRAAASMFGHPDRVVLPWSVTKQGPGAWLRSMALLTGFRDELGAAGLTPGQLESAVFGFLQGAERDMSSKTGEHRESQGSWHGALMSSGNESIVGQITNEGIAARVVEITGPLTLDNAHAVAVDRLTLRAHGHGLAALAEDGPAPDRFAELAAGQLAAIGAPAGGVPYRLAGHLSMGAAGAAVLAELAGVPEFAAPVVEAARGVLAELVAALAERGARPGDRLLAALAGSMSAEPAAWPTRGRYEKALAGVEIMPREVYGWDLAGDTLPGDVAVIATELRGLALAAGINDPGIALRELRKRGLLAAPADGRHMARLVKVAGKPHRAYVIAGVTPDEAENGAGNHSDGGPVTTSVTTSVTTPDQGGNHSNHISGGEFVCAREDHETAPAEPVQHALPLDGPAPLAEAVTIADAAEPCQRCGQPCRVRRGGRVLHMDPCPEPATRPAQQAVAAPTAPVAPVVPARRPGPANGSGRASIDPDRELYDFTRAAGKATGTDPAALDPTEVRAALDAWHAATGGLQFREWAGTTGIVAYEWLNAKAGKAARGIPLAHRLDSPMVDAMVADALLHLDYVNPDRVPAVGQRVTELDVNGQFLGSAQIYLGTGEPIHVDRPHSVAGFLNSPGYVRLAADVATDHPALRGRLTAGRALAMPTVRYLVKNLGAELDAAEAIVWTKGNARPHLADWYQLFRRARLALLARGDRAGRLAEAVRKDVMTALLGGLLRSEDKNPSQLMRKDWSDHIITEAWVRALIAVGTAAEAGHVAVGMRRDSAWFLSDDVMPFEPAGMKTREPDGTPTVQLGKWKVNRYAEVTPEIVAGHASGSADVLNKAIKAAHEAREAGR